MNTILGVVRNTGDLIALGTVSKNGNHANLTFAEGALSRFETELRPFALLARSSLREWPDTVLSDLESKIWANPVGKRKDKRPLLWAGYPTVWGALLIPAVPVAKLPDYEPTQDGFLAAYRPVECGPWGSDSTT